MSDRITTEFNSKVDRVLDAARAWRKHIQGDRKPGERLPVIGTAADLVKAIDALDAKAPRYTVEPHPFESSMWIVKDSAITPNVMATCRYENRAELIAAALNAARERDSAAER